jgi:hypothetical protein
MRKLIFAINTTLSACGRRCGGKCRHFRVALPSKVDCALSFIPA